MVVSRVVLCEPRKGISGLQWCHPMSEELVPQTMSEQTWHRARISDYSKPYFRQMRGSKYRAIIYSCSLQYYYPKLKYHLM